MIFTSLQSSLGTRAVEDQSTTHLSAFHLAKYLCEVYVQLSDFTDEVEAKRHKWGHAGSLWEDEVLSWLFGWHTISSGALEVCLYHCGRVWKKTRGIPADSECIHVNTWREGMKGILCEGLQLWSICLRYCDVSREKQVSLGNLERM